MSALGLTVMKRLVLLQEWVALYCNQYKIILDTFLGTFLSPQTEVEQNIIFFITFLNSQWQNILQNYLLISDVKITHTQFYVSLQVYFLSLLLLGGTSRCSHTPLSVSRAVVCSSRLEVPTFSATHRFCSALLSVLIGDPLHSVSVLSEIMKRK